MTPEPPARDLAKDEMPDLLEALRRRRSTRRIAHGSVCVFLAIAIFALFLSLIQTSFTPVGVALFLLCINAIALQLQTNSEMFTLRRIANHEDVRSLPVLLDTYFETEFPEQMYVPVLKALNATLPKASASDRSLFTQRHINFLELLFLRYRDKQLFSYAIPPHRAAQRLAVEMPEERCYSLRAGALHALAQVGDKETARVLKRFIQQQCRSNAQMEMQQLAYASLTEIEKRLAREDEAKTLLRASSYVENDLLRPSYAQAAEPPETLLRPVQSDAESAD